jgi:hypothetical protein
MSIRNIIELKNYYIYGSKTVDVKKVKGTPLIYLEKGNFDTDLKDKDILRILRTVLKFPKEEKFRNLYEIIGANISYNWSDALGFKSEPCPIYPQEEYETYSKKYFNNIEDSIRSIFKKLNTKYIIICKSR